MEGEGGRGKTRHRLGVMDIPNKKVRGGQCVPCESEMGEIADTVREGANGIHGEVQGDVN